MNFTIPDVKLARFKRQQGYESYHPVGWDSLVCQPKTTPLKLVYLLRESMATIIPNYHKQYKAMGWSNDWSKEISTHEPKFITNGRSGSLPRCFAQAWLIRMYGCSGLRKVPDGIG